MSELSQPIVKERSATNVAAATTLELAALDGNFDKAYRVYGNIVVAINGVLQVDINGAPTGITGQQLYGTGGGVAAGALANSGILGVTAGDVIGLVIDLPWAPIGTNRNLFVTSCRVQTVVIASYIWADAVTDITKIGITHSVASGIAAGSALLCRG